MAEIDNFISLKMGRINNFLKSRNGTRIDNFLKSRNGTRIDNFLKSRNGRIDHFLKSWNGWFDKVLKEWNMSEEIFLRAEMPIASMLKYFQEVKWNYKVIKAEEKTNVLAPLRVIEEKKCPVASMGHWGNWVCDT